MPAFATVLSPLVEDAGTEVAGVDGVDVVADDVVGVAVVVPVLVPELEWEVVDDRMVDEL